VQREQRVGGAAGLGLHAAYFSRLEENIAGAVDEDAHAELVDDRHLNWTCLGELDAGKFTGRRGGKTRRHLQGIATIEIGHGNIPKSDLDLQTRAASKLDLAEALRAGAKIQDRFADVST